MALMFSRRSGLYTFCIVAIFLATILYIVSFLAPYWQRNNPHEFWQGIWFSCSDDGNCRRFDAEKDYMKAVRILQVLGFVGLVIGCFFILFGNCRQKDQGRTRTVEVVTLFAALIGFAGAMVYLGFWKEDVEASGGLLNFAWAFAMNVGACALAILAAILLFFANKNLDADRDSDFEPPHRMEWDTRVCDPKSGPAGPVVVSNHRLPPLPHYRGYDGVHGGLEGMRRGHYSPDLMDERGKLHHKDNPKFLIYPDPYPYPPANYIVASSHRPRPQYRDEPFKLYGITPEPYYEEEHHVSGPPHMVPVVLPRLVIRGHNEPGYGYQEYKYQ